ncbi:hypothetical protein ACJJIQ_03475 [Microbulbifer sp. ANSA003]|uniref:hypothetical protein n=1 Tax=Microbulbifer sp. ANSA003 TaxID=3243360 RepID=UPI00404385AD
MNSRVLSRELGRQEALYVELTKQSKGGLQLITFTKVCEPLTPESLCKGFAVLHQHHPLLRARVVKNAHYKWVCDVKFSDIPIKILQLNNPLNFELEYARQAENYLDSEKYAYSLTIFTNDKGLVEWVVFNNIHAVMDGRSIMTIYLELDRLLLENYMEAKVESLPLQESIVNRLGDAGYVGEKHIFHGGEENSYSRLVETPAPVGERRANAIARLLNPDIIRSLAKIGKPRNIRITSMLCAVASIAAETLPGLKKETEIVLAMDVRGLCDPPISFEHVGSFSYTTCLKVHKGAALIDFLDLAEDFQFQVLSALSKKTPLAKKLESVYTVSDIENMAAKTTFANESFMAGICVSNLGSLDKLGGKMKIFEVEKGMVTQTNGLSPLTIISYTTNRNSSFIFGYCEPLLSHKSAVNYADRFIEIIRILVSQR